MCSAEIIVSVINWPSYRSTSLIVSNPINSNVNIILRAWAAEVQKFIVNFAIFPVYVVAFGITTSTFLQNVDIDIPLAKGFWDVPRSFQSGYQYLACLDLDLCCSV